MTTVTVVTDDGRYDDNASSAETEAGCCYAEEGQEEDVEEMGRAVLVPVVFCVVVAFGCLGNLLVMVVVIKNKEQFANTTNLFILNLAMADLFFLVFCVPFHAVIYTTLQWPFGEFLCRFVHLVQYSSMVTSILTLVAMSLDRFLAVVYPLHTKHLRTPRTALVICVVIWTAALIIATPFLMVYTVRVYDLPHYGPLSVCADDWGPHHPAHRKSYYLGLFVVAYLLPVLLISVFSALTVATLWSMDSTDGPSERRSVVAKRRVTRLIGVVVTAFALSWLPSHVVWLWTNYFANSWGNTYPFYYGRIAAHLLSYANSCMNPVIYAFMSSKFRNGFRRALCCRLTSSQAVELTRNFNNTAHGSVMRLHSKDDAV